MQKNQPPKFLIYALLGMSGIATYLFLQLNGVIDSLTFLAASKTTNLAAIFFVGLLAGGLSCMAVQGGLLAATIAQREEEKLSEKGKLSGNMLPIISFLGAKLAAYTALGFLLGWFGSFFKLSLSAQIIMQLAVALFMIGTALAILDVHPIFRYFIIQPPRFLTRMVRRQSRSADVFAPALLGGFTVAIPCGVTQGMMALAIASGNPFLGAAILASFVLGTSPVFFALGYFATQMGERLKMRFLKIASVAIILLALFNLGNTLALAGIPVVFSASITNNVEMTEAASNVTITINSRGYAPTNFAVKRGSNVTLHVTNTNGAGCQQAFTIPSLAIQKVVPVGASQTFSFKAPENPTKLLFSCSMGMFRGVIEVI